MLLLFSAMNLPDLDSETYTRLEKLAVAVAKHGDAFEAKVAEKQQGNADFAFLTAKQGTLAYALLLYSIARLEVKSLALKSYKCSCARC